MSPRRSHWLTGNGGLPSRDIHVWGPHEEVGAVRAIFSKRHIYTVNAVRTGDGCGFQDDDRQGQRARGALAVFLERALVGVPELELFVRYFDSTTQRVEPSSYDWIGPSDIRTWRSCF